MAKITGDKDIQITIGASDQTQAAFNSAKQGMEGMSAGAQQVQRQIHKLGDANEYAAAGIKRMRGMLEGIAFGVVIGAVAAVTEQFVKAWQSAFDTEEIMNKLNQTIIAQAGAWKILPESMNGVTKSAIDLYNAQLTLAKFYGKDEIPKIEKEIKRLEDANKMAGAEIFKNSQMFKNYSAGLFNAEVLNKKNTETILKNNVALAEQREKLTKLKELLDMKATTLDKVTIATGKLTDAQLKTLSEKEQAAWFVDYWDKARKEKQKKDDEVAEIFEKDRIEKEQELQMFFVDLWDKGRKEKKKKDDESAEIYEKDRIEKEQELAMFFVNLWDKARKEKIEKDKAMAEMGIIRAGSMPGDINEIAQMGAALQLRQNYYDKQLILLHAKGLTEIEITRATENEKLKIEEQTNQMRLQTALAMAGMMTNTMQALFVATGSKHRAMFQAYKTFAVANAMINAYLAASNVLANESKFGATTAYIMAGMIYAQGLAQAYAIASQDMTGSVGAVSTTPGGGTISTGRPSPSALTGGSQKQGNVTYVYYINAMDTETFSEYVKRNSGAITGVVAQDIKTRGEVSFAMKGNA